jgi:hypothetical protein
MSPAPEQDPELQQLKRPSLLDLNAPDGHELTVTLKPEEKDGDRRLRLVRETAVLGLGLFIALAIAAHYVYALYTAQSAAQAQTAVQVLWSGGGSGLVGYLLGTKK